MYGPHQIIKGWPGPDPRLKLDASPTFELIETKRVLNTLASGSGFIFTGLNGDGKDKSLQFRMRLLASGDTFIGVYLNGTFTTGEAVHLWNTGAALSQQADGAFEAGSSSQTGIKDSYLQGDLWIASGGARFVRMIGATKAGAADARWISSAGMLDNTTEIVNRLELRINNASPQRGTQVSLYRVRT